MNIDSLKIVFSKREKVDYLQIWVTGVFHCGGVRVVVHNPAVCGCVVHFLHSSLLLWFLFWWLTVAVLTWAYWNEVRFRDYIPSQYCATTISLVQFSLLRSPSAAASQLYILTMQRSHIRVSIDNLTFARIRLIYHHYYSAQTIFQIHVAIFNTGQKSDQIQFQLFNPVLLVSCIICIGNKFSSSIALYKTVLLIELVLGLGNKNRTNLTSSIFCLYWNTVFIQMNYYLCNNNISSKYK